MTQTDLTEQVRILIEKNGRATQRYLFDVFVNSKKKYKNISKYQIKKAVGELLVRRRIYKRNMYIKAGGVSVLYLARQE